MTLDVKKRGMARSLPWRIIGWSIVALLLALPLIAMQFTDEVNWTLSDFIFVGVLVSSVGIAFELTVRATCNASYRAAVAAALTAAFLIIFANGAVGMIGSEDNPYNLAFGGVILLALVGSVATRFRARGMAMTMAAASMAQVLIACVGMFADLRGGILSALLAGPWLLSSAMFANAARDEGRDDRTAA